MSEPTLLEDAVTVLNFQTCLDLVDEGGPRVAADHAAKRLAMAALRQCRDAFNEAFYLGFAASCEGFNAECVYDHLAGSHADPDREQILGSEEFQKLRDQAWERTRCQH